MVDTLAESHACQKGWEYRSCGRSKRVAPYKRANLAAAWLRGFDEAAIATERLRREALG